MVKVLFINPTVRHHDAPRHIPYGKAILIALSLQEGHQVQIYDENAWRPEDPVASVKSVLRADDWDVIATGGLTTTYNSLKSIIKNARAECPNAVIVGGGGFLTAMPLDIMSMLPELDVGVIGEAYRSFPNLLKHIGEHGSTDLSAVAGIIHRTQDGTIKMTQSPKLLTSQEMDELPYPAWEMFPLERYWNNSDTLLSEASMGAKRRLDINASYGCALICRFCWHLGLIGDTFQQETENGPDVFFTYDRTLRWHSPKYIVDMVRYWYDKHQIDMVAFLDENLMTMHRSSRGVWLPEICRLWIEAGLQPDCVKNGVPHDENCTHGVHWGGTSHAGQLDEPTLRLMHEAGCTHLDYGLESFNDRILSNIGKGTTAKKNKQAIDITMNTGIRPIPNQIIGFPDEFFDSIYDNMLAWEETGVVCYPFLATAYPGSEWYTVYKETILEQYDGDLELFISDLDDATKVSGNICENFSSVELLGLRELMVTFNYRKIREFEEEWWSRHETVRLPMFLAKDWKGRAEEVKAGTRDNAFAHTYVEFTREEYNEIINSGKVIGMHQKRKSA